MLNSQIAAHMSKVQYLLMYYIIWKSALWNVWVQYLSIIKLLRLSIPEKDRVIFPKSIPAPRSLSNVRQRKQDFIFSHKHLQCSKILFFVYPSLLGRSGQCTESLMIRQIGLQVLLKGPSVVGPHQKPSTFWLVTQSLNHWATTAHSEHHTEHPLSQLNDFSFAMLLGMSAQSIMPYPNTHSEIIHSFQHGRQFIENYQCCLRN